MPPKAPNNRADELDVKRTYYELDNALRNDDDEAPDPGRIQSAQMMQMARARKQQPAQMPLDRQLPRSASDGTLAFNTTRPSNLTRYDSDRPKTSTADVGHPSALAVGKTLTKESDASVSGAVPSSRPEKNALGKRKRGTGEPQIPDKQKIFSGLHFYFFPNSDKNKARKARVEKAIVYGATWEQDFSEGVTHVIVDSTLDFASLIKFLKVDSLSSSVIIVNERYPADCLTYWRLLDPRQPEFRVKGCAIRPPSPPGLPATESSLQLHPAGRDVQTRPPKTPETEDRQSSSRRRETSTPSRSEAARSVPEAGGSRSQGTISSTEEFDAAIKQARELQYAPLDNEDEPESRPTSSEGTKTDDEAGKNGRKLAAQTKPAGKRKQDSFQCMKKHTGKDDCPNAATIAILQQMATYYEQIGDQWRPRAYRKAVSTLRNHPTKVCTREEALALPQIGERLATKIEEIALTNRLRRLDNATAEPNDQILRTFMQVYGAGPMQASKWVTAGYQTLDELREKAALTENQRIGIDHYEDFNARIPRAEVERHGAIVRKTLQAIDGTFEVIVGGSYRRGADTSGDIDCLVTRPNTGMEHIRTTVLDQLVPRLFAQGFLVAALAATSHHDGSKWHGASQLPASRGSSHTNPWRRIDLLLVPSDEIGAALIYFTGNDIFNRSLRLLASTKGMRLNQRGLYKDVIRGKGREKLSEGTLVEGKSEKRIFEILEVPWRPPEHRIC